MMSASDSSPLAAASEKAAADSGVATPISMPRSSAAVLTTVSTPSSSESCTVSNSSGDREIVFFEEDTAGSLGLVSKAIKLTKKGGKTSPRCKLFQPRIRLTRQGTHPKLPSIERHPHRPRTESSGNPKENR